MWEKVKLGSIAKLITGKTPPTKNKLYFEGNIPFLTPTDFGSKYINKTLRNVSYLAREDKKINLVKENTVFISCIGNVGKVIISKKSICSNQQITALELIENVDVEFIYYYLMSIQNYIAGLANNAVVPIINNSILSQVEIPLPPLSIQKQIVSILDRADELRRTDKTLEEKYDELAQSIFIDMFGDPMKNDKGWEKAKISSIVAKEKHSIKAGPFGSSLKKEFYVIEGYKIYGQEQVIADDLKIGNYYIDKERYDKLLSCAIKEGDVLISLVGSYGRVSIVPEIFEKGIINPRLMKITLDKTICFPFFFKFLMQLDCVKRDLSNNSRGGTMDIINVGIVSNYVIIIPPIELQNEFARKIEIINQMKEQEMKGEELFQSLLQKAFKGELVS